MAFLRNISERFWGPIRFQSGASSELVGSLWGDVEVRVQGNGGKVFMKAGSGRARGWEELSVADARKLAAGLLAAADVASGLSTASASVSKERS